MHWKSYVFTHDVQMDTRMPVSAQAAVDTLFADDRLRWLATSLRSRRDEARTRVLDAAYARQLNASDRASWPAELRSRSGTLGAPSWLWNSVVDLAAAHEAAYLQHCRRYDANTD